MSEEIIPAAAPEVVADVEETAEAVNQAAVDQEKNLSGMTLAELSARLEEIVADPEKMKRS